MVMEKPPVATLEDMTHDLHQMAIQLTAEENKKFPDKDMQEKIKEKMVTKMIGIQGKIGKSTF